MKKATTVFATLLAMVIVSLGSFSEARSIKPVDTFTMHKGPKNTGCEIVMILTMDYFENTATTENYLSGYCTRHVEPETRVYKMDRSATDLGNGIWSWHAVAYEDGEKFTLIIEDYRNSSTPAPAYVISREYGPNARLRTMYNYDLQ